MSRRGAVRGAVRREPAVVARRRDLRDAERPGIVQQPLRRDAGFGRIYRAQRAKSAAAARRSWKPRARHSAAIMSSPRRDPGWDMADPTRAPTRNPMTLAQTATAIPTAFRSFSGRVARQDDRLPQAGRVRARRLPLVPRIDKPLLEFADWAPPPEFRTHRNVWRGSRGSGQRRRAVGEGAVDASSPEAFAYQPQVVPANRTAVPAP